MKCSFARLLLLTLLCGRALYAAASESPIEWRSWGPESFAAARDERKLILLNLEAVWCHWCHVMDQQTYSDPAVAELIEKHFIAIKVDHDARPDLANRYRDYGWPATLFLDADGTDLVKRAGYIEAENFVRLMNAIVADPTPEKAAQSPAPRQYAAQPKLAPAIYTELLRRHRTLFDQQLGGLKSGRKTLDRDHVEFALMQARQGDAFAAEIVKKTVQASFALIDPEWGGIYQYSTFGDWRHPHFEKIMSSQAGFLRIYALAYAQMKNAEYLAGARSIVKYLDEFLTSPNGALYTSQDADLVQGSKATDFFALTDEERRLRGIPRIDTNIYARENGWAIEALAMLYEASGEADHLTRAERAATALVASHSQEDGGFKHRATDDAANFLADTLNMGAGFLQLYKVSAQRHWLEKARRCGDYILSHFRAAEAGYYSGLSQEDLPVKPVRHIEENTKATRFLNLLAHYVGDPALHAGAAHGMRYLATGEIALGRIEESGVLIAATELAAGPPHFTVVGDKRSPAASKLYAVGLEQPGWYKRLEWWDKKEGPLANPDVSYPGYERPAGFICVNRLCSAPTFTPEQYRTLSRRLVEGTAATGS